jgi:hypothetical protein
MAFQLSSHDPEIYYFAAGENLKNGWRSVSDIFPN